MRTFVLTYGTVGVRIGCDLDEQACRTQALFDVALKMPTDVVVTKCYRRCAPRTSCGCPKAPIAQETVNAPENVELGSRRALIQ